MKYTLGLLLVVIISALSLLEYNTAFSGVDRTKDVLPLAIQVSLPCIAFSIFLTRVLYQHMTYVESLLIFFLFALGYFGMALTGVIFRELMLPVAGGLGGMYVAYILKYIFKYEINLPRFFVYGFLSTVPGFILRFVPTNLENQEGIMFSLIVGLWQLVIGYIVLREIELIQRKKRNPINDLLDQNMG